MGTPNSSSAVTKQVGSRQLEAVGMIDSLPRGALDSTRARLPNDTTGSLRPGGRTRPGLT